jgi:hypothetical protein
MEQGKVVPIHPDYLFSNVSKMLFVGKMGLGKANDALKRILIADHLVPQGAIFIKYCLQRHCR